MRVAAVALLCLAFALPGCLKEIGIGGSDAPGPRDYVSSGTYTKWVIELDVVEGQDAPSSALALLESRLEEVVDKPGGVEIRRGETLQPRGGTWTQEDVLATAGRTQDLKTGGDTVTLHLLLLDGQYSNANVLGVTFFQKSGGRVVSSGPIALFSEAIRGAACPPPLGICLVTETSIFQAVLVHEFGHAMGLVNSGAPMQTAHEDEAHPGHSTNQDSVMYFEVETVNVANVFRNGPPNTFDSNDKKDLCALGGKC